MLDTLFISVHIPAGLIAVGAGLVAMFARKGAWWHRKGGMVYLYAIFAVATTAAGLVATRGFQFAPLLVVGLLAATLAYWGYRSRRTHQKYHILGMGTSYIAMLTAFYVDNGPKLPFWEMFPGWSFWILPSLIGLPIVGRAIARRGWRCIG